jgi:hypothetical protein
MAALDDNRDTPQMATNWGSNAYEFVGVDSEEFYKGAIIMFDASDGKVKPAAGTGQSDGVCVGRCEQRVTTGTSNTLTVKARDGVFRWENGETIAATDIGAVAYADDDQTVFTTQGTTRSAVGRIVDVDSIGVWVATMFPGFL